jgi:hypothetical protein
MSRFPYIALRCSECVPPIVTDVFGEEGKIMRLEFFDEGINARCACEIRAVC